MHGLTGGDWKRAATSGTAPVPDPPMLELRVEAIFAQNMDMDGSVRVMQVRYVYSLEWGPVLRLRYCISRGCSGMGRCSSPVQNGLITGSKLV